MPRIVVLASFNVDLVMRAARRPDAGETLQGEFAMHLGGKGFNQAVAARRLGADVAVAGRVGDDEFGRMFFNALDREDIDRRAVDVDPAAGTGVATITVEPDGTNTIIQAVRANGNVCRDDWERGFGTKSSDDVAVSRFFQDGDVAVANLETGVDAAADFFRDMFNADKRDCTLLNAAPAGPVSDELMRFASTIVVNEREAKHLTGIEVSGGLDAAFKAAHVLASRARTAVITLGHEGAIAVRAGTRVHLPAFDVPVVDTTGAGDAFCAALAVRLNDHPLGEAVRFANAAGALACIRAGAEPSMPRRNEVEALLRSGSIGPLR